uniref:RRM domain-containing protein n=1 Tax=Timema tahoe TaxID=61484 RepID=A0A7R9ICX3_9NEOP|nr:unnamed protein product [Timema tahoe]
MDIIDVEDLGELYILNNIEQVCITFDDVESAKRAKEALYGADIYSGCCTLKIDFAKFASATARFVPTYSSTRPALGCLPVLELVSIPSFLSRNELEHRGVFVSYCGFAERALNQYIALVLGSTSPHPTQRARLVQGAFPLDLALDSYRCSFCVGVLPTFERLKSVAYIEL